MIESKTNIFLFILLHFPMSLKKKKKSQVEISCCRYVIVVGAQKMDRL